MFWSFLWRFVLLFALGAAAFTFVVGFTLRLFGVSMETTHSAGLVAQTLALLVAAAIAVHDVRRSRRT